MKYTYIYIYAHVTTVHTYEVYIYIYIRTRHNSAYIWNTHIYIYIRTRHNSAYIWNIHTYIYTHTSNSAYIWYMLNMCTYMHIYICVNTHMKYTYTYIYTHTSNQCIHKIYVEIVSCAAIAKFAILKAEFLLSMPFWKQNFWGLVRCSWPSSPSQKNVYSWSHLSVRVRVGT